MMKIAILSDTHGKLREDIASLLTGYDQILHAGDLDTEAMYDRLSALGPTFSAVRGNCDWWAVGDLLPLYRSMTFQGLRIFMVHRPQDAGRFLNREHDIVICGHTHCYRDERIGKVRYINPGSVSEPRDGERGFLSLQIDNGDYTLTHILPDRMPPERAGSETGKGTGDKPLSTVSVNTKELCKYGNGDASDTVKSIMKLTDRGKEINTVSSRLAMPRELVEHIVRLYLTHPGIDADGILNKLGL